MNCELNYPLLSPVLVVYDDVLHDIHRPPRLLLAAISQITREIMGVAFGLLGGVLLLKDVYHNFL